MNISKILKRLFVASKRPRPNPIQSMIFNYDNRSISVFADRLHLRLEINQVGNTYRIFLRGDNITLGLFHQDLYDSFCINLSDCENLNDDDDDVTITLIFGRGIIQFFEDEQTREAFWYSLDMLDLSATKLK